MPLTKRLYPYQISQQLELKPRDPHDPTNENLDLSWLVRPEASDEETVTLDLTGQDLDWRELRLQLHAHLPESETARILSPGSTLQGDTTMVVSAHCPATKLRNAFTLTLNNDGDWSGEITIRRNDVRSVVRLTPRLVRKTDAFQSPRTDANCATARGLIIAEGRNIDLVVDLVATPPQGLLRTQWEDFSASSNPWRREHDTELHHLDVDADEPTLWLNARHRNLKAALHSHATKGGNAAIRHLGNALLAQTVWLQLFMVVVSGLEKDPEGTIETPRERWKRAVLSTLVSHTLSGLSEEEQLQRLYDMRASDQVGSLVTWLGSAAQRVIKCDVLVKKAIAAAEQIGAEE